MNKPVTIDLLILVDAQLDFFSYGVDFQGSLDASNNTDKPEQILDNIVNIIKNFSGCRIIYSQDWHPIDHISFNNILNSEGNSGPYPVHCLQGSRGAQIHPVILEALHSWVSEDSKQRTIQCIKKACGSAPFTGSIRLKEDYDCNSVFGNAANEANSDMSLGNSVDPNIYNGDMLAEQVSEYCKSQPKSNVYIAGFVTNICVLSTILDLAGISKLKAIEAINSLGFSSDKLLVPNASLHARCQVNLKSNRIKVIANCCLASSYDSALSTYKLLLEFNIASVYHADHEFIGIDGIPDLLEKREQL